MKTSILSTMSRACLLSVAALFAGASQAAYVPLNFSNYQGTLNDGAMGSNMGFNLGNGCTTLAGTCVTDQGGGVYGMRFTNVGTDGSTTVDAVITYATTGNASFMTSDRGYIPAYYPDNGSTEPNDDFGFLYDGTVTGTNSGVDFTITFYDGTGANAGTFTNLFNISEIALVAYDIDGESTQDEYVTAYGADGLYSYALDPVSPMFVNCDDGFGGTIARCSDPGAGNYRFDGPDVNRTETDTRGAVYLNYRNTSSVTLSFGSYLLGGSPNFVFSAIDGDLSLFPDDPFDPPVVVPVPAAVWLFGSGLLGLVGIARRRTTA